MPEIQTLLREYGEHLEELAPAITVNELDLVHVRPAGPIRLRNRPAIVFTAAALLVLVVIGGLGILFSGGQTEPVASTAVDTIPPTVPTSTPAAAPEPTTPTLSLPPPPALGEAVELHPDQEILAGVWIEAALTVGNTDISVDLDQPDIPGIYRSGDLVSFPTENDAREYLTSRMDEEMAPELEQPDPIGLGDESLSYRALIARAGQANIHVIRVGRLVYESRVFGEQTDPPEEIFEVVAAMASEWTPSLSAYHGSVKLPHHDASMQI